MTFTRHRQVSPFGMTKRLKQRKVAGSRYRGDREGRAQNPVWEDCACVGDPGLEQITAASTTTKDAKFDISLHQKPKLGELEES